MEVLIERLNDLVVIFFDDDDADDKSFLDQVPILLNFFSSLQMTRLNKLECLFLAITFQSS
jgi:hypothetical protein